jgi:hypothetical protein
MIVRPRKRRINSDTTEWIVDLRRLLPAGTPEGDVQTSAPPFDQIKHLLSKRPRSQPDRKRRRRKKR